MTRYLVTHVEQVASNVLRFPDELESSPGLQVKLGLVHAWYALRVGDRGWIFGPSKFVGYAENTAEEYVESYQDDAHGGQTEKALAQWFAPVEPGSRLGRELMDALKSFLAQWGRVPRKGARISVVSEGADDAGVVRSPHNEDVFKRISTDPTVCGGRPCIKGTRIRVSDIVDMVAAGATRQEILDDFPYLADEDITAALTYAARATDHRVIRAA